MFFFFSHSLIRAAAAVNRRRDPAVTPPRLCPPTARPPTPSARPRPRPRPRREAVAAAAATAPYAVCRALVVPPSCLPSPCPCRAPATSCVPSPCPCRAPAASPHDPSTRPRPVDSSATRRFVPDPSSRPLGMIRFNLVLIRLIFSFLVLNLCTCMIRLILSIDDCRPSCR
jgi:hypothetical protein